MQKLLNSLCALLLFVLPACVVLCVTAACAEASDAKACRARMLKAQRLWIQYKEAMADALYALGSGGTMDQLTVSDFAARETKKQAQLLATE